MIYFPLEGGRLFNQYRLRLLGLRMRVVEEGMGVEVRSLYYLFEGMLYRGNQLLGGQVSFQSPRL